jgi:hypothetical protein
MEYHTINTGPKGVKGAEARMYNQIRSSLIMQNGILYHSKEVGTDEVLRVVIPKDLEKESILAINGK